MLTIRLTALSLRSGRLSSRFTLSARAERHALESTSSSPRFTRSAFLILLARRFTSCSGTVGEISAPVVGFA